MAKKSAKRASKAKVPVGREKVPLRIKTEVLTEAGYRCAVPTCRTLLLLDLHHLYQVSEGGGDSTGNLIALCPNCHARYHRGDIPRSAIFAYKSMLVALSRGFDLEAIDLLLFLEKMKRDFLKVSGDGVLVFARLIAAGLADVTPKGNNNDLIVTYSVNISPKGRMIVEAWRSGDHVEIAHAISGPVPGLNKKGRVPKNLPHHHLRTV